MLGGHFPTHPASVSAINWMKRVVLADRLFKGRGPVVRFEDFLDDPVGIATRLIESTGIDAEGPPQDPGRAMHFGANHIVAGNPDKFEHGEVEIRRGNGTPGVERRAAAIVSAMTLPMLRRYRYPITAA
jgi:hypothetical protein